MLAKKIDRIYCAKAFKPRMAFLTSLISLLFSWSIKLIALFVISSLLLVLGTFLIIPTIALVLSIYLLRLFFSTNLGIVLRELAANYIEKYYPLPPGNYVEGGGDYGRRLGQQLTKFLTLSRETLKSEPHSLTHTRDLLRRSDGNHHSRDDYLSDDISYASTHGSMPSSVLSRIGSVNKLSNQDEESDDNQKETMSLYIHDNHHKFHTNPAMHEEGYQSADETESINSHFARRRSLTLPPAKTSSSNNLVDMINDYDESFEHDDSKIYGSANARETEQQEEYRNGQNQFSSIRIDSSHSPLRLGSNPIQISGTPSHKNHKGHKNQRKSLIDNAHGSPFLTDGALAELNTLAASTPQFTPILSSHILGS